MVFPMLFSTIGEVLSLVDNKDADECEGDLEATCQIWSYTGLDDDGYLVSKRHNEDHNKSSEQVKPWPRGSDIFININSSAPMVLQLLLVLQITCRQKAKHVGHVGSGTRKENRFLVVPGLSLS
ncbi:hypothetical protein Tco_0155502 [Tanacetum coccineum]